MANEHYSAFIEETFIQPIRSVLIIDDDYPTFDEILETRMKINQGLEVEETKRWHDSPDHIKSLIDSFRSPDRALLVDIHDGSNVTFGEEAKVAAHLHQSDLLVLDYELDKAKPRDGAKAIEIVRSVMRNDHFNLVIVHTREGLDNVFNEVLIGLLCLSQDSFSEADQEVVLDLIEIAEDEEENFSDKLLSHIGIEQYFHSRSHTNTYIRTMRKGQQPYSAFAKVCESAGWDRDHWTLVLKYALLKVEQGLRPKINQDSKKELQWSTGPTKWILSDSVFIAFSLKAEDNNLLAELHKALNNWSPQPSRLFLAKLRAEIDEYGVVAQGHALGNKFALALWYYRLLEADEPARRWLAAESVARHSDQLLAAILPRVEDFASRLVAHERANSESLAVVKYHFKVDLELPDRRKLAEREHNAFVCSKKPEGWHLTTGHVFLLGDEYWVCLSPACDMVPSQLSEANVLAFQERLPFIAVKLEPVPDFRDIDDVQTNRYVFLRYENAVKSFRFTLKEESAPQWRTLFAERRGQFKDGTFDLDLSCAESGTRKLIFKKIPAKVISQLRYEYALNLMQRLGVFMTRAGLDFV